MCDAPCQAMASNERRAQIYRGTKSLKNDDDDDDYDDDDDDDENDHDDENDDDDH